MKVLVDTDLSLGEKGSEIDDGVALALAVASDEIDLVAVTTVNGNTHVETSTILTIALLEELGRSDVPVYAGARDPLLLPRHQKDAPHLTADQLAEYERVRDVNGSAAEAIVRLVRAHPGELTILAIGPLTNLALALRMAPDVAEKIVDVYVMGGYFFGQTNRSAMAGEFNVWADPHAFDTVLTSGVPLSLVGLDVTRQLAFPRAKAERMAESDGLTGTIGRYAVDWVDHLNEMQPNRTEPIDASYMHDPLVVVAALDDHVIQWRDAHVRAETVSTLTRGIVIADLLTDQDAARPNARIAVGVDVDQFWRAWSEVFIVSN
jgi:inosine-uridine nucleoside N-ribohydrolase